MNKVTLIGNVVRDLELKTYNNQAGEGSYVQFTLAIDDYRYKTNENATMFIDIVAFGKQAEILGRYLTKGNKIAVEGKIRTGNYINNQGQKKYSFEVILEDFQFLGRKKEEIV